MTVPVTDRFLIDTYAEWVAAEGMLVHEGLAIDLNDAETRPWDRLGVDAAMVHLDAQGDFCNLILVDLPPGAASNPWQHLFESIIYVLDGNGSTVLTMPDGSTTTFEWGPGSLFSIPLNLRYQLLNASGTRRARLACMTNMPMLVKLFRDDAAVFDTDLQFPERWPSRQQQEGTGTLSLTTGDRFLWTTNLVPDVLTFDRLQDAPSRGRGNSTVHLVLAENSLHAHISEIPPGNYKKAHRHSEGYLIIQLSGAGYSLYWFDGEPVQRVNWRSGMLHSPQSGMWHQHFNLSDEPSRYLAVAIGGLKYPFLAERHAFHAGGQYRREGTAQIEYEDEDPEIDVTFRKELAAYQSAG